MKKWIKTVVDKKICEWIKIFLSGLKTGGLKERWIKKCRVAKRNASSSFCRADQTMTCHHPQNRIERSKDDVSSPTKPNREIKR